MTDKWLIKPTGDRKLEITLPDDVVIEARYEIGPEQLQEVIARWLELRAQNETGEDWCI